MGRPRIYGPSSVSNLVREAETEDAKDNLIWGQIISRKGDITGRDIWPIKQNAKGFSKKQDWDSHGQVGIG